jgi:hypothetical protein
MPEEYNSTTGLAGAPAPQGVPRITLASKEDQKATRVCYYCCTMIVGKRYRVGPNLACGNCAARIATRAASKAAASAAAAGAAASGVGAGTVEPGTVGAAPAAADAAVAVTVGTGTVGAVTADAGQFASGDGSFALSLVLGIGAALVGLAFYATFTIVTHFYVGYVALAVGWLVGKAIKTGSKGVGGPKYQITAVVLTYAAISLAEIPILIARTIQHGAPNTDWAAMAPKLILWGIASPFLELQYGVFGIIGLVILFVGLRIAWRVTAAKRGVAASAL